MQLISPDDLIGDVLARGDDAVLRVFVRSAPHFAALRDLETRRAMERLVTVTQAAATAGVPVDELVRQLNEALGVRSAAPPTPNVERASGLPKRDGDRPSGWPEVLLDVRPDLRAGKEPFPRIMAAVAALPSGSTLHLRAPFQPVPLFDVLGRRGFRYDVVSHADDDWSIWFWRESTERSATVPGGSASAPTDTTRVEPPASNEHWLDVRELEMPEPMVRTLAALEQLAVGEELVQVNVRVPHFLLPVLQERGFEYEIDETFADRVLVRVRHRA